LVTQGKNSLTIAINYFVQQLLGNYFKSINARKLFKAKHHRTTVCNKQTSQNQRERCTVCPPGDEWPVTII